MEMRRQGNSDYLGKVMQTGGREDLPSVDLVGI